MIKVAIMGFGTVGGGVAEVLCNNRETIARNSHEDIEIKYILDIRDFPGSPFADKLIKDFSIIENDPEVRVVAETIGGKTLAYDFTKRLLLAGKSVVTSNKELVATYGTELLQIAKEKNVNYLFEASVGGGIPIIRPLTQCMLANNIDQICGILNGTTNYILTRMIEAGKTFEEALSEAQQNGYAEANPSADVDGIDACRKICILTNLAYGKCIDPDCVYTEGIRSIALEDVNYAKAAGKSIKLIGRCLRRDDGKVNVLVAPHLVSNDCPLAGVNDVFNAIMVTGDAVGDVMFYGRGAGALPTASAVVADIIDAVKHLDARKYLGWTACEDGFVAPYTDMEYSFYIRVRSWTKASVEKHFSGAQYISAPGTDCAFITPKLSVSEFEAKLSAYRSEGEDVLSVIRVLN